MKEQKRRRVKKCIRILQLAKLRTSAWPMIFPIPEKNISQDGCPEEKKRRASNEKQQCFFHLGRNFSHFSSHSCFPFNLLYVWSCHNRKTLM